MRLDNLIRKLIYILRIFLRETYFAFMEFTQNHKVMNGKNVVIYFTQKKQ